jgi:hypothetical protein
MIRFTSTLGQSQLGSLQLGSAPLIPSYMGLGLGSKVILAGGLSVTNVVFTTLSTRS